MTDNVISIMDRIAKRATAERQALDPSLPTKEIDMGVKIDKIRESIKRINDLMNSLKEVSNERK